MGYTYEKLKSELTSKKYAEDGFVAWGRNSSNKIYNPSKKDIDSPLNHRYTLSKMGEKLLVIPFTYDAIEYKSAYAFSLDKMLDIKLHGFWVYSYINIITKSGKKFRFNIYQGRNDIKKIIKKFNFKRN